MESAVPMRGQLIYVNGREQARFDLALPPEVPYGFAALAAVRDRAPAGGVPRRASARPSNAAPSCCPSPRTRTGSPPGWPLASGGEEVRARFLIGCDGAHSIVRKGLGLTFEGGAFAEEYMLADVETDWDLPHGYGLRSLHRTDDGSTDDLLVCIPLPGAGRYRMSMLVPPELSTRAEGGEPGARRRRRPRHGRRTASRSCPTSRPSSTASLPSRPTCPACAGPPSSASATASSTATRKAGSSSRATPPTSTRPPAPRA